MRWHRTLQVKDHGDIFAIGGFGSQNHGIHPVFPAGCRCLIQKRAPAMDAISSASPMQWAMTRPGRQQDIGC
ncbi:MAG: hypothetical protein R2875_12220 [Desulfobacterales bacterium]